MNRYVNRLSLIVEAGKIRQENQVTRGADGRNSVTPE